MKRRKFVYAAGLSAISVSIFGHVVPTKKGAFTGDCETSNDILGPFYRADAPFKTDLTYAGMEGTVIDLKGVVYGADCSTPLSNALVEIWQCNKHGEYDNHSSNFHLRGKCYADEKGFYSFKTILPGKYLNGGKYRPAHIHFRVSAENNKELISQIYFQGDPLIADDPWASLEKAERRILPIALNDTKGNLSVVFDISLGAK